MFQALLSSPRDIARHKGNTPIPCQGLTVKDGDSMKQHDITRRSFVKAIAAGPLLGGFVGSEAASASDVKRVGSIAQRLKAKPYEKRVCRVENYPSCLMPEDSYTGLSVEEYV